ncbi:MAG: hypothetical protein Kow00120_01840 [Anaerolineae bacterium]
MKLRNRSFQALFAVALLAMAAAPLSGALAQGLTTIHVYATDTAPADGVVGVYINYNYEAGEPFQPAGVLMDSFTVSAGQRLDAMLTGYPYQTNVRVWFTPAGDDPVLLPSQYYPDGEFGTGAATPDEGAFVYATSFASAVESVGVASTISAGSGLDTPVLGAGALQSVELDDGLLEWGYWLPDDEDEDDLGVYVQLGWSQVNADGTATYTVPDDGPVTAAELARMVEGPKTTLRGGALVHTDMGEGLWEWGYWVPNDDGDDSTEDVGIYTLLGWSQVNADDTVSCSVSDGGPLTASELCQLVNTMN